MKEQNEFYCPGCDRVLKDEGVTEVDGKFYCNLCPSRSEDYSFRYVGPIFKLDKEHCNEYNSNNMGK